MGKHIVCTFLPSVFEEAKHQIKCFLGYVGEKILENEKVLSSLEVLQKVDFFSDYRLTKKRHSQDNLVRQSIEKGEAIPIRRNGSVRTGDFETSSMERMIRDLKIREELRRSEELRRKRLRGV